MPITYLEVVYAQRGAVKALGARWDAQARKWFVPEGRDLAPFDAWLPAEHRSADTAIAVVANEPSGKLQPQRRGKSLSQLLAGVAEAVERAYRQSEWTVVDLVQVNVRRHVFLEVAERDANGLVLAKANAMIWASTAEAILPVFESATGMSIGAGMKLLVRARPVFSAQYGFRLIVDAIDPDFTLGELEARKREIRARLQQQGLLGMNKALAYPWDFQAVLVVAPAEAAGLGDFQTEAHRLDRAGVCRFVYAHSRFQGPGAAQEIVQAAQEALAAWLSPDGREPDAVVFIRGGGSVNDLAWLNEYELARFVCELKIPVLTGIGHERDSTILDEVAHTRFDTPSKVIAGIESTIARRVRETQATFAGVMSAARQQLGLVRQGTERASSEIRAGAARHLFLAREGSGQALNTVRLSALRAVASAERQAEDGLHGVRGQVSTQVVVAKERTPQLLAQVQDQALAQLRAAAEGSSQRIGTVLERARLGVHQAGAGANTALSGLLHGVRAGVSAARSASEALLREISGQGPQKTLARGFAHVRDAQGRTTMSAKALTHDSRITVTFHDGTVPAKVQSKEGNE